MLEASRKRGLERAKIAPRIDVRTMTVGVRDLATIIRAIQKGGSVREYSARDVLAGVELLRLRSTRQQTWFSRLSLSCRYQKLSACQHRSSREPTYSSSCERPIRLRASGLFARILWLAQLLALLRSRKNVPVRAEARLTPGGR